MSEQQKSLCILGRQPALSLAELESLYGGQNVQAIGDLAAALSVEIEDMDFGRLGGTIKLARILTRLPHDWPSIEKYLVEQVPHHLQHMPEGKFTIGVSVYGMDIDVKTIERSLLRVKKAARVGGRSVRIVPNRAPELNSAQVLHNKLTTRGGWELLLVRDGQETILAQSMFVQDIDAYTSRDRERPKRDATVGMLSPKLAQTIINLANPPAGSTVLDPFCGTGVILQEALLMSYNVVGTDLDERMVAFTDENLSWLRALKPQIVGNIQTAQGDATDFTWPAGVDAVASELYLGRPLTALPANDKLKEIVSDVNTISTKFLKNLVPQLKSGARLCVALPAWANGKGFIELPLIDHLPELGYNRVEFQHAADANLIYWRPGQIVGRRLLVLTKV